MKFTLARLQSAANVAGAALLLWLSMPLLTIGGTHPLESSRSRAVVLLWLAVLLLAALAGREAWRARRNARLLDQLQAGDATVSQVLAERFGAAMQLLKNGAVMEGAPATGWQRWRRALSGGRQVYKLPWYLIMGAPGAGKTTALLHSGLRFPLAERLGAAPVAGIGGTRHCDWWFTDRAVFIDTAGRYTTQDSHAAGDAREWRTFLQLLRRHRPVQPVNGVIVTVSVPDLLQGGAELEAQAAAVDLRLQELRAELGLSFPVYLLVTKADLLAGFVEFFADFDAPQREQLWGLTFDAAAAALPQDLSAQLSALAQRIGALSPQRLQQEPQPQRRAAIYHFAAQVEALLPALEGFARRALGRTGAAPRQSVRGIFLSSGTQEGNPIDRVLGELARSYGMAVRTLARPDAGGKAYFLKALLQQLVIAEAPLAGSNLARARRRRRLAAAAGAAVAVGLVLGSALGWRSYRSNLDYVDSVRERVEQLAQQTGAMAQSADVRTGRIDDLLPLYDVLGSLAVSGAVDPTQPPPGFGFGLFQGPRLAQAADQTYHRVLDQTLAPLLVERLSQALGQTTDPAARYEALRIGMMLVTPGRMQRDEVRRWAAAEIAAPARPGPTTDPAAADGAGVRAPGDGEQQEWLRHLDALLERNVLLQAVRLDGALVASTRKALAGVPLAERVHQRLLSRASARFAGQLTLADVAGSSAALSFATPEAALPAVYARAAWREAMAPALDATIRELAGEAAWVLDDRSPALQRMAVDGTGSGDVAQRVAQRHARIAGAAWDRWLGELALAAPVDGEAVRRLGGDLAGPGSAPRALMQRLANEFPAAEAASPASELTKAYDAATPPRLAALGDYARGPGPAAIARLAPLLATALRDSAAPPAPELARDLRSEAARAPAPLREIWAALADGLRAQAAPPAGGPEVDSIGALSQACRQLIDERFPFAPAAKRDMPYADFARLFGPGGLLDAHFRNHFAAQVDVRSRPWKLPAGAPADARLQASLRAFEMAADIRSLFFARGDTLPQLALKLTPMSMDEQLLQFSIDVDGQLLRYENGPRRTKPLQWPGPGAAQRVLLRIFPTGPSGIDAEVHEGPWALLRVLQRQGWQRQGQRPAGVRVAVDGRSLNLEAATDGPVSIDLLAELPNFRCPQ